MPEVAVPEWVPLGPAGEQQHRLRQRWVRRDASPPRDWDPAPGASAPNCRWARCPEGVPWCVLEEVWRVEAGSGGPRCKICGEPLAAKAFGFGLSVGTILRDCLRCNVSFPAAVGSWAVREWLERTLHDELRPDRLVLGFRAGRGASRPAETPWARFGWGHWTRTVPRRCGTYLVADRTGSTIDRRTLENDVAGRPLRQLHRDFHGWWWNEPLPRDDTVLA